MERQQAVSLVLLNLPVLNKYLAPHHDGSELYVSNLSAVIGDRIELRVRVPITYTFEKAFIRLYEDGEPRSYELLLLEENEIEQWWGISVTFVNKTLTYRFVFISANKYEWLNARGLFDHDVHSNNDFKLFAGTQPPTWIHSSVFYQIFPDRFAKSDAQREIPDWAKPRPWNSLPDFKGPNVSTELFGGDLKGVEEKLDYIAELGVNGIYFTPFFPARSNHRYDASSFDEVDPILGGNEALHALVTSASHRNIRVLADLTSNHCGAGHRWLAAAKASPDAPERAFFYWDKTVPHGYVGWWGVPSLPKLNFNSQRLRELMYGAKDSIVKKWLTPEFAMAGWRIDVGNMTGRLGDDDLHDEVMHGIRQAIDETRSDAWLVAENGDFVASDLDGSGWHGAMNYQGFMRPVWNWLNSNTEIGGGFQGLAFSMPKITGSQLASSMKEFNASIPWNSLLSCMLLLDSHDTARMRTVVSGDKARHLSGMALVLSYPGVPSIFAGDEIGLEGTTGEDSRRTINWEDRTSWDLDFHGEVKELINIRRSNSALINGGLRWIAAEDGYIAYLRESKSQSFLVIVSREPVDISLEISDFGYARSRKVYGKFASGDHVALTSDSAAQGIWEVTK